MHEKVVSMWPTINVKLDEGAYLPERAHETDAGADIRTPEKVVITPRGSATIHTGVHVELPRTTVGMLKSKSGLNVNHNVTSEGVIDEGYDGEIVVKLYNLGDEWVSLPEGAKVTQLVVMPVCYPAYVQVDEISAGERGSDGFGSTESATIMRGPRL